MTLNELLNELGKLPREMLTAQVVVSKDAEGNNFSPFAYANTGKYVADSTWSGELYIPEDGDEVPDEEKAIPVVCLWPVN